VLVTSPAVAEGLTSVVAGGGRHGEGWMSPLTRGVAGGGLKVARNLTTACTRPRGRRLSSSLTGPPRRVMPGVRLQNEVRSKLMSKSQV
jgi:hypothetical protein